MSIVKILLGSMAILGGVEGQSQATQAPHSKPPSPSHDMPSAHGSQPSHDKQGQETQKSARKLTPLEQGLLDQIQHKIKAHITQVSCESSEGKSIKVDLNQLAKDIKNRALSIQKTSKDYTFQYHSGKSYECPHAMFTK